MKIPFKSLRTSQKAWTFLCLMWILMILPSLFLLSLLMLFNVFLMN